MSLDRIHELAHAEEPEPDLSDPDEHDADQGEPEHEGEQDTPPGEPLDGEPDTEPEQTVRSEKEIEQVTSKLERESSRHLKRLTEIMGEDAADLLPCELCPPVLAGYRFDVPVPEEVTAAVLAALGVSQPRELSRDPYSQVCNTCNGEGQVASGSRVQGQEALTCVDCGARGWIGDGHKRDVGQRGNGTTPEPTPPAEPTIAQQLPPEAELLRRRGFTVIAPLGA